MNADAVMWTDGQGWTPLHVAMLYGLREEAVVLLIKYGGSEAVMSRNNMGWTPLLLALRHGANTRIIQCLLEADCRSSLIGNHAAVTPVLMLWFTYDKNNNHRRAVGGRVRRDHSHHNRYNDSTMLDDDDDNVDNSAMVADDLSGSFLTMWNEMILLLKAASFSDDSAGSEPSSLSSFHDGNREALWYVLHASIKYMAPTEFIKLVMKMHPEQLRHKDADGRLPLHIAAACAKADHYCLIDQLVLLYPNAAIISDYSGRLPLNLSLDNGGMTWQTGVQRIFQAAPEIIQVRDAGSKLYPFMLAAAHSCRRGDDDDCPAKLDTIYKLLCANPGLVVVASADV